MNWGIEDFAAAAVILAGVAVWLIIVFATVGTQPARAVLAGGVILGAATIWAHLAVGVF